MISSTFLKKKCISLFISFNRESLSAKYFDKNLNHRVSKLRNYNDMKKKKKEKPKKKKVKTITFSTIIFNFKREQYNYTKKKIFQKKKMKFPNKKCFL